MSRVVRALYSALMVCAQPLLRAKLRRRGVTEPGYLEAVDERFGRYAPEIDSVAGSGSGTGADADSGAPLIWLHAVSLGETRAAAIVLTELRTLMPRMRLLLTHGTATGRAEGRKLLRPGDVQVWQPWDTPGAVGRFLDEFQPAIGVLMETEIWPNLVAGCQRRGVPLVLANARLNDRSLAGARRLAWLARPAYAGLTTVWAQTDADAARLRTAGAQVEAVFGNVKFDTVPDAEQLAQGHTWRAASPRPVVLLASSREGEEAMWIEALRSNRPPALDTQAQTAINSIANGGLAVQWLVVPRHPQRFAEVRQLIEAAGMTVSCRSAWAASPGAADVWLGDSLGEMALYYGMAHAALLGGSFAPLGGQNLIEAAACGCPVVTGPHTFNFAEAARLACDAGAALRVADLAEGIDTARRLVHDAERLAATQAKAIAFTRAHRGAALSTAMAVVQRLRVHARPLG